MSFVNRFSEVYADIGARTTILAPSVTSILDTITLKNNTNGNIKGNLTLQRGSNYYDIVTNVNLAPYSSIDVLSQNFSGPGESSSVFFIEYGDTLYASTNFATSNLMDVGVCGRYLTELFSGATLLAPYIVYSSSAFSGINSSGQVIANASTNKLSIDGIYVTNQTNGLVSSSVYIASSGNNFTLMSSMKLQAGESFDFINQSNNSQGISSGVINLDVNESLYLDTDSISSNVGCMLSYRKFFE